MNTVRLVKTMKEAAVIVAHWHGRGYKVSLNYVNNAVMVTIHGE